MINEHDVDAEGLDEQDDVIDVDKDREMHQECLLSTEDLNDK